MLRPATPLTIILFCAFVLLLVSSLSAPVIRSIPLARWQNYNFGVLGYCDDSGRCSDYKVGYTADNIFGDSPPPFNLPTSARHSLSSLLIVHPVAAFMTLIMLALAAAAHFHAPSHSPRYLLALLILTLPTLLITLLAFLVDILLFIPQLAWGGWICLAATILIVISGICLCAMRRTLVSRKARRKRIQENAEMSGENFYNRQREQESKMTGVASINSESKAPLVGGQATVDALPTHAKYEQPHGEDMLFEQPRAVPSVGESNRHYGSAFSGPTLNQSPATANVPPNQFPDARSGPTPEGQYTFATYGRGRGGPPMRGGGYPRPYGRGGPRGGGQYRGPPPGGFHGRGGYGPGARGAYRGRGGAILPPGSGGQGYAVDASGRRPPPGYPPPQQGPHVTQYGREQSEYAQPVSPSDYSGFPSSGATFQTYIPQQGPSTSRANPQSQLHESRPQNDEHLARAESPPPMEPIGQANDTAAAINKSRAVDDKLDVMDSNHTVTAPAEQYVPARANWRENQTTDPVRPHGTSTVSQSSSRYYEDIPNKFQDDGASRPEPQPRISSSVLPPSSFPGANQPRQLDGPKDEAYEETRPGARSPATSEQSAWTSVSQRPVNPHWATGHGGEFNSFGPHKKQNQSQARHDVLLSNNPDFSVPGTGPPRGTGRTRGGFRGPPVPAIPPGAANLGGDGRYPEPSVLTSREI